MPYKHIFWDMDGVMIPGRGTTHMANGYEAWPAPFKSRFLEECGGLGALQHVKAEELESGFRDWETQYNGGRPISTIGQLGTCLTDLRHKLKVFKSAKETTYTKNAILHGMTLNEVLLVSNVIPYIDGVEASIEAFRKAGLQQYLFTSANEALAASVAWKFGFQHCEGARPRVVLPDGQKVIYDSSKPFPLAARLSGEMEEYGDKLGRILKFAETNHIDFRESAAIDDTDIKLLEGLKARGSLALGFYNISDRDMSPKHREQMAARGIRVLENDVSQFANIVLGRTG
jgi:hypothetical protein